MNCKSNLFVFILIVVAFLNMDVVIAQRSFKDVGSESSGGRVKTEDVAARAINEVLNSKKTPSFQDSLEELTDANYDSVTLDPNQSVFVAFVVSWCGHCRKLLPVLADVAEHYKSQSDVRIVKIDAEKNKNVAMRFGFQGFPAMVFYAKNSKAHEFYKGRRDSIEIFIRWINDRAGKVTLQGMEPLLKREDLPKPTQTPKDSGKQTTTTPPGPQQPIGNTQPKLPPWVISDIKPDPTIMDTSKMTQTPSDEGFFKGVGDTELYYRTWALEERYGVVILLHGLSSHSGGYQNLVSTILSAGFSVYAFDLRGHGRSQGTKGQFESWRHLIQDLQLFLQVVAREEGSEKIFLMGHDVGGLLALDFAIEHPQSLQGIIPIAPLILGTGLKEENAIDEDKATNLFSEVFSSNSARFLTKDALFASTLNKDTLSFYDYELQTVKQISTASRLVSEKIKRLNVPTLFVLGSSDQIIGRETIVNLLRNTATSFFDKKMIVFEGLLHRPFDDVGRDQVMNSVLKWVLERTKSNASS